MPEQMPLCARPPRVITPLGAGRFTIEVIRGVDKWTLGAHPTVGAGAALDSALVRSPERQETVNQRRRRPEDCPVNDPDRTALALQVTTQRIRYRHAMCVLSPIESCRRACSSGVVCARITHMNTTVTTSTTINVSRTRISASSLCGPDLHRPRSALGPAPRHSQQPVPHAGRS